MADRLERLSAALADRYRLERELGAGGMATVYLAEDRKHERPVALKVLRPELAALDDALQISCEVADALSYAHIRDVVHREIKPENGMLPGRQVVTPRADADVGLGSPLG